MSLFQNTLSYLKTHGLLPSFHYALYWLRERSYEKRFQSDTSPKHDAIKSKPVGDGVEYQPVSYSGLKQALDTLAPSALNGSFIDYGCGKGRALLVAALFPFQKVIGIEYDSNLVLTAQSNVLHAQAALTCHSVEVIESDATLYDIPQDASVFFFYQPFLGETLSRVLQRVEQHISSRSESTTVVTFYPTIDADPFLQAPYVECIKEFSPYKNAPLIFRIHTSSKASL